MSDWQRSIRPSIVRVQSGENLGTGFWVKGRTGQCYILTCTHVLNPGKKIQITLFSGKETFEKKIKAKILQRIPISSGDITLLQVAENDIPNNALPLQLLDIPFLESQPFQTFGFPDAFSEHGRPAHGTVVNNATSNDRLPLFQLLTEMDIRQGFSGGPIVHTQMGYSLGMISDGEESTPQKTALNPYALTAKFITERLPEYLEAQVLHPYQVWLASLYHDVVLNDEKGMQLSDIYVAADGGIHELCVDKSRPPYKDNVSKNGFFSTGINIHDLVTETLSGKVSLKHEIKNPLLTLLLGYPGQGKTSFTKRLIHDCIFHHPNQVIYLVRLRYVIDTRALLNNPFLLLEQEIIREIKQETGAIINVDFDNAILVLDGLDELSIKSDMNSRDVDDIVSEIIRNSERYTGLHILITSRYGYTNLEKLANRNILILQLSEYQYEQQKIWLNGYLRFHPESHLTEQKLEMYNNEYKYLAIRELITQPILLQMVATLEEDLSDAVNRSAIYTKLFDQLIKRGWDKGGNIAALHGLRSETLRHALQDMAYATYHAEKGYLYKSALDKLPKVQVLKSALDNKIDIWRSVMVAFYMDEVRKSTPRENEDDREHDYALEFLHKSLYEYLCAEKIWRDIQEEFNVKPKKSEHTLENLWELFGSKIISLEIVQYLIEIIQNDTDVNRDTLSQNLAYCMTDWLGCDFLPSKGINKPLDTIYAVFYGYWTILSHVKEETNFFQQQNWPRLINLVSLILQSKQRVYLNLSKSDISSTDLDKINLSNVNMSRANLSRAYWSMANLSETNLFAANLSDIKLPEANLIYANLSHTNLIGAGLVGANLSGANLEYANLSGADLTSTNLQGANLKSANLQGAKLYRANLTRADLSGANLNGADLLAANLIGADLSGANLSRANLYNANFSSTDLVNTDLSGAKLDRANFHFARLVGANLSGASLFRTNLDLAFLNNANLSGAILERTILSGAILEYTNLDSVTLLVIEQLQIVLTLYECKNISSEMEDSLRQSHPHLFDKIPDLDSF